jgi:hypothetical protein
MIETIEKIEKKRDEEEHLPQLLHSQILVE